MISSFSVSRLRQRPMERLERRPPVDRAVEGLGGGNDGQTVVWETQCHTHLHYCYHYCCYYVIVIIVHIAITIFILCTCILFKGIYTVYIYIYLFIHDGQDDSTNIT